MTCPVFLEHTEHDGYTAIPFAFPDCVAVGKTRDEALANLRAALNNRLAQGEIVMVEVGEPEHPWLKGAGMFKDDPAYGEFLREIETYRRTVDKAEIRCADLS